MWRSTWSSYVNDLPPGQRWVLSTIFAEVRHEPDEDLQRGQMLTSVRRLADTANVSKGCVERALKNLKRHQTIATEPRQGRTLITLCHYEKFKVGDATPGTVTGTQTGTATGTPPTPPYKVREQRTEKVRILAEKAIAHLNQRMKTRKTVVPGVLKDVGDLDDYTAEDFERVIDAKVKEWRGDPKMRKNLRPSTLFRPVNFRRYHSDLDAAPQPQEELDLTPNFGF